MKTKLFVAVLAVVVALVAGPVRADGDDVALASDPTIGMVQLKSVDITGSQRTTAVVLTFVDGAISTCALFGPTGKMNFYISVYEKAQGTYAKITTDGVLYVVVRNLETEHLWWDSLVVAVLNARPRDVIPTVRGANFR